MGTTRLKLVKGEKKNKRKKFETGKLTNRKSKIQWYTFLLKIYLQKNDLNTVTVFMCDVLGCYIGINKTFKT